MTPRDLICRMRFASTAKNVLGESLLHFFICSLTRVNEGGSLREVFGAMYLCMCARNIYNDRRDSSR